MHGCVDHLGFPAVVVASAYPVRDILGCSLCVINFETAINFEMPINRFLSLPPIALISPLPVLPFPLKCVHGFAPLSRDAVIEQNHVWYQGLILRNLERIRAMGNTSLETTEKQRGEHAICTVLEQLIQALAVVGARAETEKAAVDTARIDAEVDAYTYFILSHTYTHTYIYTPTVEAAVKLKLHNCWVVLFLLSPYSAVCVETLHQSRDSLTHGLQRQRSFLKRLWKCLM